MTWSTTSVLILPKSRFIAIAFVNNYPKIHVRDLGGAPSLPQLGCIYANVLLKQDGTTYQKLQLVLTND